ncbi:MAG: aminoacyl-tRNA hydrolase [Candidatus Nealsonbacteria bacterium]
MILIIGLGNPNKKYKFTRHNLGFRVLDRFSEKNYFPEFKSSKKFKSLISKGSLNRKRVILAKPQTFMNNSGKAARILVTNYKIPAASLWVIHDDIDLELGKIKIVKNKRAAGHKGVQSIIDGIRTKNFIRFRIGINPDYKSIKPFSHLSMEAFVLQKFTKTEKKLINKVIKNCLKAIEISLKQGIEKAMNEFN